MIYYVITHDSVPYENQNIFELNEKSQYYDILKEKTYQIYSVFPIWGNIINNLVKYSDWDCLYYHKEKDVKNTFLYVEKENLCLLNAFVKQFNFLSLLCILLDKLKIAERNFYKFNKVTFKDLLNLVNYEVLEKPFFDKENEFFENNRFVLPSLFIKFNEIKNGFGITKEQEKDFIDKFSSSMYNALCSNDKKQIACYSNIFLSSITDAGEVITLKGLEKYANEVKQIIITYKDFDIIKNDVSFIYNDKNLAHDIVFNSDGKITSAFDDVLDFSEYKTYLSNKRK